MKKIKTAFILIAAIFCFGCNMDLHQEGTLDGDTGIQSADDIMSYLDGVYVTMRSLTTGDNIVSGDVQTDCYHALTGNRNWMYLLYSGNLQVQLSEFENFWSGFFGVVGSTNYILGKIEELTEEGIISDNDDLANTYACKGEALFFRGFSLLELAQKFCDAYDPETAVTTYGLPFTTVYNPTLDNSKYVGRSTLEATYEQIMNDLTEALKLFEEYVGDASGDVGRYYLGPQAAKALIARTALVMRDHEKALSMSESVINSRRYALANTEMELKNFWGMDKGADTEAIWMLEMTYGHTGAGTGNYFLTNSPSENPEYIPTADAVAMFNPYTDKRYKSTLDTVTVNLAQTTATVRSMFKYPGNPELNVGINNFANMSKPLRIAEQYLIAAEAAAELGDAAKANNYLNTLKGKRFTDYTHVQLTGEDLIASIRLERKRELYGEGHRLNDLKRWGIGFERSEGQDNSIVNTIGNIHRLSYAPGDYRFTWPIPQAEMEANPQLAGQQNRGY